MAGCENSTIAAALPSDNISDDQETSKAINSDESILHSKCQDTDDRTPPSSATTSWPLTVPPMLLRTKRTSLPKLQMERLIGRTSRASVQRQCQLTRDIINRLGVSAELQGHRGCVNCIEFNDTGRLLVSGSDDYQLLLWDVHSRKKLRSYTTSHTGNIFSVKFLPSCGSGLLVSGAGDRKVEVRDIESAKLLHTCTCHGNRVKRVATSPHLQHTFFTAAEDGIVLQYDLRAPHQCDRPPKNVVVDLRPIRTFGYPSEMKCATLSPRDPNKLAVGANDPFVRVYDRRMIKLSTLKSVRTAPRYESTAAAAARLAGDGEGSADTGGEGDPDYMPPGCCQYYVPGHLPSCYRELQRKFRSLATTYLSYSPDGRHLLANLGGENIYLYDTTGQVPPVRYTTPPGGNLDTRVPNDVTCSSNHPANGISHQPTNGYHASSVPSPPPYSPSLSPTHTPPLPPHAEMLKTAGNERYGVESWVSAVMLYSEALQSSPESAALFSQRAAALMHRNWEGDTYAALRDCFRALAADPKHPKTYHKMARCLQKLGRNDEAKLCMDDLKRHNTEFSRSFPCSKLYSEILNEVFEKSASSKGAGAGNGSKSSSSFGIDIFGDEILSRPMQQERKWRREANDYLCHYAGHCNTTTDIKEAVFLGQSGDFIAAGSDDGNLFVWETATGNVVRLMPADENIVNCVQCHPNASLVATSGIGHTVKLWEPTAQQETVDDTEMEQAIRLNQTRMNGDPLQMFFMHMGDLAQVFSSREGGSSIHHRMGSLRRGDRGEDEEEDDDDDDAPVPQHAIEFLRIPRPDDRGGGGGDGSGGAGGDVGVPDVQCRTC